MKKEVSRNFIGNVGTAVSAVTFSNQNYQIDKSKYDAEGNWAFCRFDHDEIYAVRIGFLTGKTGFNHFIGEQNEAPLQLHIELMTKEGAILWLPSGRFSSDQLTFNQHKHHIQMIANGKKLFSIDSWPSMNWYFTSDNDEITIELKINLDFCFLMPDCILPTDIFSMWASYGSVAGQIQYDGKKISVTGHVFYDHPRLNIIKNKVDDRSWYLYTPIAFENGASLFTFYSENTEGNPIDYYCFALFIDQNGTSKWLLGTTLKNLIYDDDKIPQQWRLCWPDINGAPEIDVVIKKTAILKSWGSEHAPQKRKDFCYIPLVSDAVLYETPNNNNKIIKGIGLSEYWRA